MNTRKPIQLPYISARAKRNWWPLKCKPCGHMFWYNIPSVWNFKWLELFMKHKIICPNCGNKDLPCVLIFDVNDEYGFKNVNL